jgi:two-component system sensor histidine kinase DegS
MRAARDSQRDGSAAATRRSSAAAAVSDQGAILDFNERERSRIGFDLHDGPAQTLSAAVLQLKMLEGLDSVGLRAELAELRALMARALEETYELIEQLRSRALDAEGLKDKLEACVREFSAQSGVDARFVSEGPEVQVSPSLQIAVFRIVQEALSNVRRHACAERVDVTLHSSPDEITCTVVDDGCGFAEPAAARPDGGRQRYGLVSMQERAKFLDGECVVTSRPGHGTRVEVRIPVWRG